MKFIEFLIIIVTKIKIVEKDDSLTDAIYVHDDTGEFHLFIDKNQRLRTNVKEFRFVSETSILEI